MYNVATVLLAAVARLHEYDKPDITSAGVLALIKELNNLADAIERDLTSLPTSAQIITTRMVTVLIYKKYPCHPCQLQYGTTEFAD